MTSQNQTHPSQGVGPTPTYDPAADIIVSGTRPLSFLLAPILTVFNLNWG
jgi:hypothetical protein